ncbi:MAG TPA: choice-of-anchor J domain-containing protein, partial [Elainellaceae cyanobacterium]
MDDTIPTILAETFDGGFPPLGWTTFNGEGELDSDEQYFPGSEEWSGGALGDNSVAFVFGEDIENGLAQDWLVTTLLEPTAENSTLTFDGLIFPGNTPSNFSVRVSTDSQTDEGDYTIVETYTRDD